MTLRTTVFIACGVLAIAALAGCSAAAPADQKPAEQKHSASARPTPKTVESIAGLSMNDPVDGTAFGAAFTAASERQNSGSFVQDVTGGAHQEGQFQLSSPAESKLHSSVGGTAVTYVSIGSHNWVKDFPKAKQAWSTIDGTSNQTAQLFTAILGQARTYSPALWAKMIRGITGTVSATGNGTVTASFDLTVEQYSTPLGGVGQGIEQSMIEGPVHVSFAVSETGLPAKIATRDSIAGTVYDKSLNYSGWGEKVDIVAPPAGDVGPLPDSLGDDIG